MGTRIAQKFSRKTKHSVRIADPYASAVTLLILDTWLPSILRTETHMHANVNSIHQRINSVLHHDYQKKESFYHSYDSNMASRNIVFYIGFGTFTQRAAKGKGTHRSSWLVYMYDYATAEKQGYLTNLSSRPGL